MANYNGVIKIDTTWTLLKGVAISKNLALQYDSSASSYEIFCLDGNIAYTTVIFRGVVPDPVRYNQTTNDNDKADFEASYKDIVTNRVIAPSATYDGYAITTANPTLIAGSDGSFIRTLKSDTSGRLITVGLGIAGTPAGGVISIQGVVSGTPIPISGSVTASNAAISVVNTAAPASASYTGGSVTTAAPSYSNNTMNALSLTTGGLLRIDGSGVTQPVSGTVTANAGTGTFTVGGTVAATQSGTWNITNITGTVSLPTGAATETSLAKLTLTQGSTTSGQSGSLHLAAVTTAAPTYTTGQSNPLSLTTGGLLRVDGSGVTQPVSGTVTVGNVLVVIGQSSDNTSNVTTKLPVISAVATTAAPTYTTGNMVPLSTDTAGALRVTGTVAATQSGTWTVQPGNTANTTPWLATISQGGNSATVKAASTAAVAGDPALVVAISPNNTVAVTGTVTANNASVSATGAAPPASATYVGGSVTTAAPTYTTGQMSALSLTTGGLLRVDGSAVTQPVSGTVTAAQATAANLRSQTASESTTAAATGTVASLTGGAVTTAAPTYTTGQMNPLSLTTTGLLRIDGSGVTQPVSGTVTAAQATAANLNATVVQGTAANLRSQTSSESNTGATPPTQAGLSGGSVTTAAPAYTTGQMSALSLTTAGALRTQDSSAVTQGSTTSGQTGQLMQGAVTTAAPTYTTAQTSPLSLTTAGALRIDGSISQGGNTAIVKAASTSPALTDPALVVSISPNTVMPSVNDQNESWSPDPGNYVVATRSANLAVDVSGRLETHSTALTDEGSFRDDFPGSALTTALSGTPSWTNNSFTVTGTGFLAGVKSGDYIKKTADANTLYVRIDSVQSDTSLTLETAYTGTTAAAASVKSNWIPTIGASGAIAVGTSALTITTGTTSGVINSIIRKGDYGPFTLRMNATVSQRIANQDIRLGLSDTVASLTIGLAAFVRFTGTSNTVCDFVTSSSTAASDTQTTTVTLPNASNTGVNHEYKVDLSASQATLSIDGVVMARHTLHIPGPYDSLALIALAANSAAAGSSTTLTVDSAFFANNNRLQIDDDFTGEALSVKARIAPFYGNNNQVITITMASLTNNSARASTAIDNTVTLYDDIFFFVKVTSAAAGTSATGYINIYGYGSVDGGTTYPEAITGTDASITLTAPPNLTILAQINVNSNAKTFYAGPFSFCRNFGIDRMPARWGVVITNQSGATLNATGGNHSIIYQGVSGAMV